MIAPGARLTDVKRRHKALVRADGAVALGDDGRLDPPHRRAGAGPRRLQRLDVLARRDAEGPDLDRRAARRDPGGDGRALARGLRSTSARRVDRMSRSTAAERVDNIGGGLQRDFTTNAIDRRAEMRREQASADATATAARSRAADPRVSSPPFRRRRPRSRRASRFRARRPPRLREQPIPRPTLTRTTPGLTRASASRPIRWNVSRASGTARIR